MALDHDVDIRSRVSREAHAALLAEERATGRSLAEQVRILVEAWGAERLHAATVLQNLLRGNERVVESGGGKGRGAE